MTVTVQKLQFHREWHLHDIHATVNPLKWYLSAISDHKVPDLAPEFDPVREIWDELLFVIVLEVDKIAILRKVLDFLTGDSTFSSKLILDDSVPLFFFEDKKLNELRLINLSPILEGDWSFDTSISALRKGHLGAVSPSVIEVGCQIWRALDHFTMHAQSENGQL